jgi:hypothetical protein
MKRLFLVLIISLSLFACSLDGDKNFNLDIVPINAVEMPTAFRVDSVTQIPISYIRPTACHEFSNFYYNTIGNERTVAIYCSRNVNQNCTPSTDYEITVPLNFKPKDIGTYHFRFWSGVNDEGVDQYIEHEVIVDH